MLPTLSVYAAKPIGDGLTYIVGAMYRSANTDISTMEVLKKYLYDHVKPEDGMSQSGDFNLPGIY